MLMDNNLAWKYAEKENILPKKLNVMMEISKMGMAVITIVGLNQRIFSNAETKKT
jgi:hypothetical protein